MLYFFVLQEPPFTLANWHMGRSPFLLQISTAQVALRHGQNKGEAMQAENHCNDLVKQQARYEEEA